MTATLVCLLFSCQQLKAQTLQWADSSNCPRGSIFGYRTTVAVDRAGNVYSGTNTSSTLIPHDSVKAYFGTDTVVGGGMVLVSTDSNGVYRWAIGGGSTNGANIYKIAPDSFGFVYLFGEFTNSFTLQSQTINASASGGSFCAKINSSGQLIWLKKMADSSYCYGNLDAAGNLLVAGTFARPHITMGGFTLTNSNTAGITSDIFVAKLDSGGTVIWARSFGGDSVENVSGICANALGDIFLTGDYKSTNLPVGSTVLTCPPGISYANLYIAKYNSAGLPQWAKRIRTANAGNTVNSIATDAWNNVYVTGEHEGTIVFGGDSVTANNLNLFYLAKYDNSGNVMWSKGGQNPNHMSSPFSVATDWEGNVWVGGNGGFLGGGGGLFVYKYALSGNFTDSIFLPLLGSGWVVQFNSIAVNNHGGLYLAANYPNDGCVIGTDTLRPHDSTGIALLTAKFGYPFSSMPLFAQGNPSALTALSVSLYPNPARNSLTLTASDKITTISLYNIFGQLLLAHEYQSDKVEVDVAGLPSGVYVVKINETIAKQFVKE